MMENTIVFYVHTKKFDLFWLESIKTIIKFFNDNKEIVVGVVFCVGY